MAKQLLETIDTSTHLYRDTRTGIAWVENGHTGCGHSAHPNIDASGSVRGMKALGYWHRTDRTARSHGFIYNIDSASGSDQLSLLAAAYCRCGGVHLASRFSAHILLREAQQTAPHYC
jgi:hypothetical protein